MGVRFSAAKIELAGMTLSCTGPAPWNQLKSPAVRQLAWCIGASPIVEAGGGLEWVAAAECRGWLERFWGELLALEADPRPVERVLGAAGPLLGKRFEALMGYYFAASADWDVRVANGVVSAGGRTVGEVDFIAEAASGEVVHFEVACKFYMGVPGSRGAWGDWRGVRVEDTLERKGAKFAAQLALDRADWPRVDRRVALMKGWLFYPFREVVRPRPPRGAAAGAPSGWWMSAEEVAAWEGREELWAVPRLDWLSQVHEGGASGPLPLERGGLVAQTWERDGRREELSRGMVVPTGWPGRDLA